MHYFTIRLPVFERKLNRWSSDKLFIDSWKNNDKWNSKTHVKAGEIRLLETKKEEASTVSNENGEVEVSWLSEEDPF